MYNLLKILALSLLLGVTGCIKEDLDKCPQVNLVFRYDADGTENVIDKYIHGAVLYFFDRNGHLITERKLSGKELQDKRGIRLILPEDTYHLVCWGNTGKHSRIVLNEHLRDCRLQSAYSNNKIYTFDPLYYASCEIEALAGKKNSVEVRFHSAHIRMEVYVYGFEKKYGVDEVPQIKMSGLDTQYDFEMKGTSPNAAVVHLPESRWNKEEQFYSSFTNVLRFTEKDPIDISIHTSQDDLEVFKMRLNKLLQKHSTTRSTSSPLSLGCEEVIIPIVIDFSGAKVSVSISPPHWKDKPVTPGI